MLPARAADEPASGTEQERTEQPAAAEEDDSGAGPPPGVEVLRVRGRGLAEIKTEVPSSVTSFDAATIEALGAQDVSDLSRVTPNVNIVQPGATQATFFIRGIGLADFSSNAAGSVTIFQDDVSLNAPAIQTGQLFDVEGVDIVRGPQGTGPFRNASAGAIRVRSRRPSAGYGATLRLTRGRYHADGGKGAHKGIIQEYEGAVEVPLAEDLLSSRFAFKFREDEPWKSNGCGGAPPFDERPTRQDAVDSGAAGGLRSNEASDFVSICGERTPQYIGFGNAADFSRIPTGLPKRVGDAHNWAARGIFVLTPPDVDWDVTLNAHGSRLDQQSTVGQAIGTFQLDQATNRQELRGFGGRAVSVLGNLAYQDPDLLDEYLGSESGGRVGGLCRSDGTRCTNDRAQRQLARRLNHRVLDQRPYRGDYDLVGNTSRDAWGTLLSAEGQLGDLDLFVIGSYDTYQRDTLQDVDFGADPLIFQDASDEAWQTYEEIRLSGELSATPFQWELGVYYLHETLEGRVRNKLVTININRSFEQTIDSTALWWSFGWDFLEAFTLEGGVRLNYERKSFDYEAGGTSFIETISTEPVEDWLEPTGELILTWHIDERAQAYARYTRGFKAGHFNSIATARPEELLADRELNDAWEAGLRGGFLDGRLRLAGAFFYYLYQDYQVFLFSDVPGNPPSLSIENAAEAELYGIELEGQLRPLEGWAPRWLEGLRLTGNFSWLEGQYIDFSDTLTFERGGFFTITQDFSGQPLANSPKYKVSAAIDWTFDLGGYGYLIPRYDLAWSDDSFFDARGGQGSPRLENLPSLPELTIAQPAFFLHGIRLAYRTPTANVEVAGWIRNLTDEVYKSFAFDGSRFAEQVILFTGEPRTMGFDVIFTF